MISVVLPVYNTGHYLERVIQALLEQDYPQSQYEMMFVDNGSSDNSTEILSRYPQIQVFSEPERGSYAARNHAIRHARGDILAFSDSDCYPVRGWLKSIEEAFSNPQTQIVMGPRIPPEGNSWTSLVSEYENKKAEMVCASNDPQVYFGYTNNMAVRKSTMDRYGPFRQRARGSDTIFVRSVVDAESTDAVRYCPQMKVRHAELESMKVYYQKIMTYGRSRKAYRHVMHVRPLSQEERLKVFAQTTSKHRVLDSMRLFILLAVGAVAWFIGGFGVSRSDG